MVIRSPAIDKEEPIIVKIRKIVCTTGSAGTVFCKANDSIIFIFHLLLVFLESVHIVIYYKQLKQPDTYTDINSGPCRRHIKRYQ